MSAKFRVGLPRDILDSRGEPAFGRAALQILDSAPDLEWEYLPKVVPAIDAGLAAQYDAIYVNTARVPEAAVARTEVSQLDRIDMRIGREQLQIEGASHAHQFAADASCPDHAERAAGEPQPHVVHPLVPAAAAGQPVLEE